jgi:hypothetical protein
MMSGLLKFSNTTSRKTEEKPNGIIPDIVSGIVPFFICSNGEAA